MPVGVLDRAELLAADGLQDDVPLGQRQGVEDEHLQLHGVGPVGLTIWPASST